MLPRLLNQFFFMAVALLLAACGHDASGDTDTVPVKPAEVPAATEKILYTWVEGLNVRDQPSTKGKTVARVRPNEPLTFTGEQSPQKETIVLRGVAYHEPWLKISTADRKDGWVFGGALKRKDELKGNAALGDTKFSFPVFGSFDLSDWEEIARNDDGTGGDVAAETITYRSEDQLLRIARIETGENGYRNTFTLLDQTGNPLKERTLEYSVEPELELIEMVTDHTDIPAKKYRRVQLLDKHYMMLNERPQMASGEWKITDVD